MTQTYTIDRTRWATLDIFAQMGNIYSEVGRSLKTRREPQSPDHEAAVCRTLDLFDATIETLAASNSPRVREVKVAKQQFIDTVNDSSASSATIASLDQYFLQFAIAARLHR